MTQTPLGWVQTVVEAAGDEQLARQLANGDAHAFDLLVERHYAASLRFASAQIGNRQDAEEAVQDAFLRVHRALTQGKGPDRFRPWLYTILVNRCRTHARRAQRWLRVVDRWREQGPVEATEQPRLQAEQDADPRVHAALQQLPPLLREAFLLKYVEELSYEEMMAITGAKLSALKMRTRRAADQLAHLIGERP